MEPFETKRHAKASRLALHTTPLNGLAAGANTVPSDEFADLLYGVGLVKA
jgi:hypothetical protein